MGRLFALAAALGYGSTVILARLSYDTGASPLSMTLFRYAVTTALMVVAMLVLRKSWRIAVSPWLIIICSIGLFMISVGHLGASLYIPVSLGAVIFYTFPLQVAVYRIVVDRQPMSRLEGIGFVLAFAGILVALGPEFHTMDWRGLVLAFIGALGSSLFLIGYEKFPAGTDKVASMAWMMGIVFCMVLLLIPMGLEFPRPTGMFGWGLLSCIAITTLISFSCTLMAVRYIGSAQAAMFFNLEPVTILLLAWLVLHEVLQVNVVIGIFMVVVALVIGQLKKVSSVA